MTPERHEAFKRASEIIDRLAAAKLHDDEERILREGAEDLFLCRDVESAEAEETRKQVNETLDRLVESGRWSEGQAEPLREAIRECWQAPQLVNA